MRQDQRASFLAALHRAREAAPLPARTWARRSSWVPACSGHRAAELASVPAYPCSTCVAGWRGRPADLGDAGLSSSGLGLLQLIEWAQSTAALHEAGFTVIWQAQCAATHHATAAVPLPSVRADSATIARQIGTQAVAELITAHQLWSAWLSSRGVRTFVIVVAE
jgi:hypothetical protein